MKFLEQFTNIDQVKAALTSTVFSIASAKFISGVGARGHYRRLRPLAGLYTQEVDDVRNPFSVSQVRFNKLSKILMVDGQNFDKRGRVHERWRTTTSSFDAQRLVLDYGYSFVDEKHNGPYKQGYGAGSIDLTADKARRLHFQKGSFLSSPMNKGLRRFKMNRVDEEHSAYEPLWNALSSNTLPEAEALFRSVRRSVQIEPNS